MKDTCTGKEAMELLGLKSLNALLRLERRYPEAFVIVKRAGYGHPRYDKTLLDRFVARRERFKEEKP